MTTRMPRQTHGRVTRSAAERPSEPKARIAKLVLAAGVLSLPLVAGCGEQPDSRAYIERLGDDTTAVEAFTRVDDRLEGTLVVRVPVTQVANYTALLNPDGSVRRLETSWMTPATNPDGPPTRYQIVEIEGDSAVISLGESLEGLETEHLEVPARTLPALGRVQLSAAMLELAVAQARASGEPVFEFTILRPGSRQGLSPNAITERGGDSVSIDFFGNPMIAATDADGRIIGITGRETTLQVEVERADVGRIDLEALAADYAERDARGEGFGQPSPRGAVEATLGEATIAVDYGRPSKRGRQIFGGLVPWERVWRTGANAATHLSTDRDLMVGGHALPAGTYTLWTTFTPEQGELIVSSLTQVWGTQYDAAADVMRVPMEREARPEPVETFTIELEPSEGGGGVLALSWDTSRFTVPIEVARR